MGDVNSPPPPTELLYLSYEGNFELECEATVLACTATTTNIAATKNEDGTDTAQLSSAMALVRLDRTVMHPQGGVQPADTGTVVVSLLEEDEPGCRNRTEFRVEQVSIDRPTGVVTHSGRFVVLPANGNSDERNEGDQVVPAATDDIEGPAGVGFRVGERVRVRVDEAKRRILSECHTAGHVVDAALARCQLYWPSLKAYHYLDGSYVEYRGTLKPNERDATLKRLQEAFLLLVEQDLKTEIHVLESDEADQLCNHHSKVDGASAASPVTIDVAPFQDPVTGKVRVVTVAGFSCPCGGTHVRSTGDLKKNRWSVTGLKCKKDVVRVKYGYDVCAASWAPHDDGAASGVECRLTHRADRPPVQCLRVLPNRKDDHSGY